MSLYIDSASQLHHDLDKNLVVTCPYCQAVAHITVNAVPRSKDSVAIATDLGHATRELRALGLDVAIDPGYPFHVVEGDTSWFATVERDAALPDWFSLELGVVVNGSNDTVMDITTITIPPDFLYRAANGTYYYRVTIQNARSGVVGRIVILK